MLAEQVIALPASDGAIGGSRSPFAACGHEPTSILASAIEMQVSRPLTLMHQMLDAAAACSDRVHHSRAQRTLN